MVEQDLGQSIRNTEYSSLELHVYNASDFYPRGSLRASVIKPPYPLSDSPQDIRTINDVVSRVKAVNPNSGLAESVSFIPKGEGRVSDTTIKRIAPEEISKILSLNYLRANLLGLQEKDFLPDDKIAIIRRPEGYSYFIVVDLKRGRYIPVECLEEIKNKDIAQYTNERFPEAVRMEKPKKARLPLYEFIEDLPAGDLREDERTASDNMDRKYFKETRKFYNRMYQADLEVEGILTDEIVSIFQVTEAVHRLSKKVGRPETVAIIKDIRLKGWDGKEKILADFVRDISYASTLDQEYKKYKEIGPKQVVNAFRLLFKAEKAYLNAILDFPWNRVGPEPFETFINVFWFRFNYDFLSREGMERRLGIKELKSELYRRAQISRIITWANYKYPELNAYYMRHLKEAGITYNMKEVEEVAGHIYEHFDKDELANTIFRRQQKMRPLELTLLLWKSLKWASASRYKDKNTINLSDLRYIDDPQIWEEKIADPEWQEIGDRDGRLVLPGETMARPLHHLKSEKGSRTSIIERLLAYEMESVGDQVSMAEVVQVKQEELREKNVRAFNSIARNFSDAVAGLTLEELIGKIANLSLLQRLLVWDRLGYWASGRDVRGKYYYSSIGSFDIAHIIEFTFAKKPYRYYREIEKITALLSKGK